MLKQSLEGHLSLIAHLYLDAPLYVYYIVICFRVIAALRDNNVIVIRCSLTPL